MKKTHVISVSVLFVAIAVIGFHASNGAVDSNTVRDTINYSLVFMLALIFCIFLFMLYKVGGTAGEKMKNADRE